MVAQFVEGLGTKVRKLVVLPVSPDVFHWVKLRSIGRQVFHSQMAPFWPVRKSLTSRLRCGLEPSQITNNFLFDVALKMGEKLNNLGTANAARVQLKVEVPPGNPGDRRKLLPVKTNTAAPESAPWATRSDSGAVFG
jgi:hypothetical protein